MPDSQTSETIRQAIRERRQLRLVLTTGEGHIVEPHQYGWGVDGGLTLWAWSVSATGTETSATTTSWMICPLGEMRVARILDETFPGPRPGYRRANKQIPKILEQL